MYLKIIGIAIVVVCSLIGWRFYVGYTAYDKLAMAPHGQYAGAENPSLVITEIMDYRCSYCRQMHDVMTAFIERHPDVRVIYRVYPVFGQDSIYEAKLAMAAGKQGKFKEMHEKLIRRDNPVTPPEAEALVTELGLDRAQFEKDVASWSATKDLLDSSAAVEALGIKFTPVLVTGEQVYRLPTQPTLDTLETLLADHLAALPSAQKAAP